jgi:hypothetical protein
MSQNSICNTDLNQFRDWVNEDPADRVCKIDLNSVRSQPEIAWVYSRSLNALQYVNSVTEIDLVAADERNRLMELMQKYPDQARALLESAK